MHKPGFGVVTGVVTVLAVIAFIAKLVIGHIPEGPENRLASEPSPFLQQAATEEIDWRKLSEETFADARKRDLPIMLVVGSACSPTGRAVDEYTFKAKEIEDFLDRNFISVRVDTMQHPELVNAFLPLSRAFFKDEGRLGIPADFQIWFLDPKGYLFAFAAETTLGQGLEARAFRTILERAARRYAEERENRIPPGELQAADMTAIRESFSAQMPDLDQYGEILAQSISPETGGFPLNGFQRLWASAWRFQLLTGRFEDYKRSTEPCLTSPRVDLLHGGFFTPAARYDWRGVGFDKVAVVNADMLRTLTLASVLMQDRRYRWLAERTFDYLFDRFPARGVIPAGEVGDENRFGRSESCSFSPRELRAMFPDNSDREWLRTNLGLRVETNPEMSPLLADLDLPFTEPERLGSFLRKLGEKERKPESAGTDLLDAGASVVARLIESARTMGDRARLLKATDLFVRLEEFRSADDVVHSLSTTETAPAFLGDYLAYSDAALQQYLANGDPDAFGHGLSVLRRALFLFGTKDRGVFCQIQPQGTALAPQDIATPEIVDNIGESSTARLIRLCTDYGRLSGPSGADLTKAATDAVKRFAIIGPGLGQYAGGFYCAVERFSQKSFAIAVGPKCVEQALQLSAVAPTHLTAPSIGKAWRPGAAPGVYVITSGKVTGPHSVRSASKLLAGAPG